MAKVMKANAAAGLAYARLNFADESVVWVQFDLAFNSAALAYFTANQSNDFCDLLEAGAGPPDINFFMNSGLWALIVQLTSQSATPTPEAATWFTIEVGYDDSTGTGWLYIDGNLILTDSNPFLVGVQMSGFTLGQNNGGEADPAVVVYIRNVTAGTSQGATDLMASDGFEGGDFSAWSSTFGDVSIVEDPFVVIAPPTQVFGGTRFYEAPPWRITVSDLEDNQLTFLDHLALDRSVTVTRAAARVMTGRVPSDNPEVNIPAPSPDLDPFVSEGTRLVSYFRREAPSGSNEAPWVIRGRGIVLGLDDDADSDHATSTFTAYDPWKYLYRRSMYGTETGLDLNYVAGTRADEIIIGQMQDVLDFMGGSLFTDFGQTGFYTGTIEMTEPFPDGGDGLGMTFRGGTTLGEMLDLLVATGTCDVVFDPIYDPVNRPGILCQMSIYRSAGEFRANAVMGWDRWPRSVVQLSRQVDGTERANILQMFAGQGGPPVPLEQDAASIAKFGDYWALQYLPGVPSIAGAHTIAQRQLTLLKDGQYTYALSPASERAPLLFEEYREADYVPVYADERFRDPINGVPVRIESIPIVIGDDELERVNQMLVSFAPESGS